MDGRQGRDAAGIGGTRADGLAGRPGLGGRAGRSGPSRRAGRGAVPSRQLSAAARRAPTAFQAAGTQVPPGGTRPRMCRWPLLLLCGLLPGAAAGGSGRPFPHRTLLDSEGKYWLSWGPRGSRLAFRLEVRTAGYVGFGFSPTGTMAAADIVVGGVLRGRPYLQVSASPLGAAPPRPGRSRPRATRLSLRPRLDAVAPRRPAAPPPLPGTRLPSPSAPVASGAQVSPLSTVTPGSFSSLSTFLSPAPHLIHPPGTHLPRTPPSSLTGKERDPGFGGLTRQLSGLKGPESRSICCLAIEGRGSQNFPHLGYSEASWLAGWVSYLTREMNERSPRIARSLLFWEPFRKPQNLQNLESPGKTPY